MNSASFILNVKLTTKIVTKKTQATMGGNLTHHLKPGDYIGYVATNGSVEMYVATKTTSFDSIFPIQAKGVPGLSNGYTCNKGSKSFDMSACRKSIGTN